jgi:hypothetical protein
MHGNRPNLFPLLLLVSLFVTEVFVTSGSESLSQSAATVIAIANMEVGAAPAGFKFALTGQGSPGKWTVVNDETSFAGRVIEQSSTDQTDHPGIAVRVLDGDNYYVVRANALEDNVRFYRVIKGRRVQIDGVNTKVTSNEWHSLGLKAVGERFTIEFDRKTLFTTSDKTFTGAGKIALWTKSDSVTRFDQITIDVLE